MALKNKRINKVFRKLKRALLIPDRYVPRIIINKELAFEDDEFYARINRLTRMTMDKIEKHFSEVIEEVISLSASNDEIYVECIGTAGEHFVTTLKMRRK